MAIQECHEEKGCPVEAACGLLHVARSTENLIDRQFHADKPNEKWLTDVTEFKWYEGITVHKIYLSAILDLCYRRIVS